MPSCSPLRGNPPAHRVAARADAHGFTLIEVLLVVAIIGIASLVAFPYLVNSIKGSRLRTAARTVEMLGRYARSMAVLRQQGMMLTFAVGGSEIRVEATGVAPASSDAMGGEMATNQPPPVAMDDSLETGAVGVVAASPNLARTLTDVTIQSFLAGNEEEATVPLNEGEGKVMYRQNGTCVPYTVVLADKAGNRMRVEVDNLSTATISSPDSAGK